MSTRTRTFDATVTRADGRTETTVATLDEDGAVAFPDLTLHAGDQVSVVFDAETR